MTAPDPIDRFTGCLLGLAVGDALGAPLSFMRPEQIQIKHGTVREMIGGGWLLLRPGQHTITTKLPVLVAESLVSKKTLDRADVAGRYAEFYRTGPKDASGALRTALALLLDGTDVEDVAKRAHELTGEESADNGTLTRAVPIALAINANRGALLDAAASEARITHWDDRAAAASAGLAIILSFVLEGATPTDAFDQAWDWLEDHSREIPNVLPDVSTKREAPPNPGSFSVDTLEAAIHHFLTAPTFEETLVRTANLGGEASVTTALAGALAGAHRGVGSIPKRWLRPLADRSTIRTLAADLLTI